MREAMARFRDAGWRTSLHSTGLPTALRTREGFEELLSQLDVAFLNQPLARAVLELRGGVEALAAEFSDYLAGVPERGVVVLTLDEHGAAVFDRKQSSAVRLAAPVTPVVDATGPAMPLPGSSSRTGCTEPLQSRQPCRAVIAGSLAVTRDGAQGRLATAAEIEALLGCATLAGV